MNHLILQVYRNWSFTRILGLIMSVLISIQFFMDKNWMMFPLIGILWYQVIMGKGCFGGACAIPQQDNQTKNDI
ncbi:MAG: hypothetical protein ACOVP1_12760 [Bacteroidia bacterium]